MKNWTIIGRHKWVANATITESYNNQDNRIRRYVATIRGWNNFKIYEGNVNPEILQKIIEKVRDIRYKIETGDESVFSENTEISKDNENVL